jgi:high-affinity K+ transport system ATPase subunit B
MGDSPALASAVATIGIALSSGASAAIEEANPFDVVMVLV